MANIFIVPRSIHNALTYQPLTTLATGMHNAAGSFLFGIYFFQFIHDLKDIHKEYRVGAVPYSAIPFAETASAKSVRPSPTACKLSAI